VLADDWGKLADFIEVGLGAFTQLVHRNTSRSKS
jgi:hypothetical protein